MQRSLIVGGIVAVLVGLGFVFPQVAELRATGALFAGQILLLGLGVALTGTGVAGVIAGGMRSRVSG